MDNEVIVITSCLITAVDFWERTKISWHCWQVLCTFTIAMIIFSVVMNGSYCQIPLPITFGYTTGPSEILCSIFKVMSAMRKASAVLVGTVFSNHSTKDIWKVSRTRDIRCWALLQQCSEHTGLFLEDTTLESTCLLSVGSFVSWPDWPEHNCQYRTCAWISTYWPMQVEFQYLPCNYGSLQCPYKLT